MKDIGFGKELVDEEGYPLHDVDSVYKWIRLSRSRPRDPNVLYAMYWLHKNHYMIRWSMAEASKFFDRAAEAGNSHAQYELGLMYKNGTSPKIRNLVKAAEWLGRSADRGDVRAMKDLGGMYLENTSDRNRFSKSASWYCRSAAAGDRESVEHLAEMLRRNDIERAEMESIIRKHVRPERLSGIVDDIDSLLESAPPAPRELKGMPQELIDLLTIPDPVVKEDTTDIPVKTDVRILEIKAEEGSADAMFELGEIYRDGVDAERDTLRALSYFEKAADLGHMKAHVEAGRILSLMTEDGSIERAIGHYSFGVEAGDADSISALRSMSFYYPRNTTRMTQYCFIHGISPEEADPSEVERHELLDADGLVRLLIRARNGHSN